MLVSGSLVPYLPYYRPYSSLQSSGFLIGKLAIRVLHMRSLVLYATKTSYLYTIGLELNRI